MPTRVPLLASTPAPRRGTAWFFLALPILTAVMLCSGLPPARGDGMEDAFARPPATARPLVYWFWMGRNVTREGITGDLEALKAAGFGGATMCHLSDVNTPWNLPIPNSPLPEIVPYVDDAWWELLHHAAREAHRLGLEFGFHNCPGYESSGGPWITPELSMQQICFSQTPVNGPGDPAIMLPRPTVDPRASGNPVYSEETGKLEHPVIPARKTYYEDIAVLALPTEGVAAKEQIIDLSSKMSADGRLAWTPPEGRWIVYRFGHTTTGALVQPAPWKATGLECDKMNPEAVAFHLNHVLGELKKHCADVIGKGIDYIWFDSYEAGTPNWTPRMREEFRARRGYELTPFLATFAKRTVGSPEESKRFAADFKRTVADLYRDVNFGVSAKLIHEAGLQVRSEPYEGPWVVSEVAPKFDQVAAEFWRKNGGKYSPYMVKEVVAGARAAHQNVVTAEAFTAYPVESQWNETPEALKPAGDEAFCDGINRFMLHRFTHEPFGLKYRPGIVMGQWGTHFDRTQTWWEPGKAYIQYLTRSQGLLQWGERVVAANDFAAADAGGGGAAVAGIRALHRHGPAGDAYFVANLTRENRSVRCEFAVAGRQPEWWDPVTGATRDLPNFTSVGGRTTVPLEFDAAQSAFIVFRKPVAAAPAAAGGGGNANFAPLQTLAELSAPWRVSFDPQWGGPAAPVEFAALTDWTQRPEPGVRYYSGTAVYRTGFDLPPSAGNAAAAAPGVSLDLGVVHDLARVRVNGRDLGVVWTAPWRVAVPAGLLKAQGNQLEIELTDCWANRLIGDEQEPADCEWLPGHQKYGGYLKTFPDWFVKGVPRPSKGRYTFTTWNYFTKDSKLIPAGLIGPVRLMSGGL